jgi:hypothetical protein
VSVFRLSNIAVFTFAHTDLTQELLRQLTTIW